MKKLFCTLLIAAGISIAAQAQTKMAETVRFNTESMSLGKVKQGVPATATFTFTNTGKAPLVIEKVMPSCSCTAGEHTMGAIKPGETGFVKATYNAAAPGVFNKSLSVKFLNVEGVPTLYLSGEVMAEGGAATMGAGH